MTELLPHVWDTRGGLNGSPSSQTSVLMRPRRPKQYRLQLVIYILYIYIYIYIKVRLMKLTHDSLLLRVSCLRTHQTVFNKENSYHLVYIQACEKLLLFA